MRQSDVLLLRDLESEFDSGQRVRRGRVGDVNVQGLLRVDARPSRPLPNVSHALLTERVRGAATPDPSSERS